MKRLLVICVALSSSVYAKEVYQVLQPVTALLKKAEALQLKDPSQSLNQVQAAEKLVDGVMSSIESKPIRSAFKSAFKNARVSVNFSPTDLKSQNGAVLALLQKASYDNIFASLLDKNTNLANSYAVALAQNLNWNNTQIASLKSSIGKKDSTAVQKQFEQAIVSQVSSYLAAANTNQSKREVLYKNLAAASNSYFLIQDSSKATLKQEDFNNALVAVTKKDTAQIPNLLSNLIAGINTMQKSL